jgi:hypothetical protein
LVHSVVLITRRYRVPIRDLAFFTLQPSDWTPSIRRIKPENALRRLGVIALLAYVTNGSRSSLFGQTAVSPICYHSATFL